MFDALSPHLIYCIRNRNKRAPESQSEVINRPSSRTFFASGSIWFSERLPEHAVELPGLPAAQEAGLVQSE
jgi:hypothetical protein